MNSREYNRMLSVPRSSGWRLDQGFGDYPLLRTGNALLTFYGGQWQLRLAYSSLEWETISELQAMLLLQHGEAEATELFKRVYRG